MAVAVNHTRPHANNIKALGLALLVHAVLLGLVAVNWRWTSGGHESVNVIQAKVVTETPRKVKSSVVDVTQDRARKKKQEAKKRQADQLRKKKAAKRRADQLRKKKAAKRRAAAAEKRHKQAQEQLQKQLAAEEAERGQARRAATVQSEAAKYVDLIGKRVSSKWQRPPGSDRDAYCIVRVRVTPGGRVLSVVVVRSSGDPAFDLATENAIFLAEPLPVPENAEVFEALREFNIDTQKL